MDKVSITLHVLFEEPFWIVIFEVNENHSLTLSRIVFGSEPKDHEVYKWIFDNYHQLKFSPAVSNVVKKEKKNSKRMQPDVKKLVKQNIGTKSQQALKLQQEQMKTEKRILNKQKKNLERKQMFDLKQQKRKEKHRGRQTSLSLYNFKINGG